MTRNELGSQGLESTRPDITLPVVEHHAVRCAEVAPTNLRDAVDALALASFSVGSRLAPPITSRNLFPVHISYPSFSCI